jgi:hypothetical protein
MYCASPLPVPRSRVLPGSITSVPQAKLLLNPAPFSPARSKICVPVPSNSSSAATVFPQRVLRAQILKIAVDSSLSERAQDLAIFDRKLFWPAQNKNERIDGGEGRAYTNTKRPTIRVEMWRKA